MKEVYKMPNKFEKNRNNTGSKGLSNGVRIGFLATIELVSVFVVMFFVGFVTNVIGKIMYIGDSSVSGAVSQQRFTETVDAYTSGNNVTQNWTNLLMDWHGAFQMHPLIFSILFLITLGLITFFMTRIFLRNRNTNKNQYGHAKLADRADIKKQYQRIPKEGEGFTGIGGLPVAADKEHYYIDTDTTNNLIVGKTRSGKGEAFIFPMIDILSRGSEKPALIINDPKEELYRSSYITLRKRGYEVHRLNLKDPTSSIGYNPLQRVVDLARLGYYDEVQQELNKITSAIYDDPQARDKFWLNSSIFLMNSLILAILDRAAADNDYSKVNMYTAVTMLTRLGGADVEITNEEGKVVGKKNRLILYFETLASQPSTPFKDMAINAFQQSKFAGEETAGNIYSSAMEKLQIYQQSNIAKLTGKSTIKLENIGFSRVFTIKFSNPDYIHNNATVTLKQANAAQEEIEKHTVEIDQTGVLTVPFKKILPDQFHISIDFKASNLALVADDHVELSATKIYEREPGVGILAKPVVDRFTKDKVIEDIQVKQRPETNIAGEISYLKFSYSEKPMAIFLETPIDNPSYNQVASFFIDQAFNTANALAISAGGKTYNRIHFLIDEFANLPKVANMDRKITLSLGMNIIWTLIVQNFEQLQINYSEQEANTIKDNSGNKVYLLSDSLKTVKEFSQYIGNQTVQVSNMQTNTLQMRSSNNQSLISQAILNETDLLQLQQGENVIVRSSKRTDLKGKKIMAYPIFNSGKFAFPFRYEMPTMSKEFNTSEPMSAINAIPDIDRVTADLSEMTVTNWDKFFKDIVAPAETDPVTPAPEQQSKEQEDTKSPEVVANNAPQGYFLPTEQAEAMTPDDIKRLVKKINSGLWKQSEIKTSVTEAEYKTIIDDLLTQFPKVNSNPENFEIGKHNLLKEFVKQVALQTETPQEIEPAEAGGKERQHD